MIVLGIDPGLANTGWGLVASRGNKLECIGLGTIVTAPKEPLPQRLAKIYEKIDEVIKQYEPVVMAVETLYFSKNSSSAMTVAHARGVSLLAGQRNDILVKEFSPNVIKQSVVGQGNAGKKQVETMVRLLLGQSVHRGSDHAMDALAAAICCIHNGVAHV